MNKLILAALGLAFGFGSISGYYLAKWDLQSNAISPPQVAIAAPLPETKPKQISLKPVSKRSELELKYEICTKSPNPKALLSRFDERTLNDLVYAVCSQNS